MQFDLGLLKTRLIGLKNNAVTHAELSEIVKFSRIIIQSYITVFKSSVTVLCSIHGISLTDIAYDSIAETFVKNKHNEFYNFDHFINSLDDSIENLSATQLYLAYKSFLIKIADAQIARLYAQLDPAGAKILRNIKDAIKSTTIFKVEKNYRGLIVIPTNTQALENLDEFPLEMLSSSLAVDKGKRWSTFSEALKLIHEALTGQSTHRRTVPLYDLVEIFKDYFRYESKQLNDAQNLCYGTINFDGIDKFEIDQIRARVENSIKEKIFLKYLIKGKITKPEAEAIFFSVKELIEDWCSIGSTETSLFKYYSNHIKIEKEEYQRSIRTKLEYLVKLAREEFEILLTKDI